MSGIPPNTLRPTEMPEATFTAPWGGFASEMPPLMLTEQLKLFSRTVGLQSYGGLLRQTGAALAFTGIPNPQEGILGGGSFYSSDGVRHQFLLTKTRVLEYNYGTAAWVAVAGAALTGGNTDVFKWTVVGQKLCFCQGVDKVQVWDGGAGGYAPAAVAAVPAKFVCEFGNHLLAAYTTEAGPTAAPQRVRWTGAGDPTDWVSANSGQTDLFNDLGPITGIAKIGQNAYIFQRHGIIKVTLTGNGLVPFTFTPLFIHEKGCIAADTLAHFGTYVIYASDDGIYVFDGATHQLLTDKSVNGIRVNIGSAILAEIQTAPSTLNIIGYATKQFVASQTIQPLNAYLLNIGGSLWMYNIDEGAWFDLGGALGTGVIIGLYLSASSVFQSVALCSDYLGFNPNKIQVIDLLPRQPAAATWLLDFGPLFLGDLRHSKTIKRVRIRFRNNGYVYKPLTVTVTNERLDTAVATTPAGSNPRDTDKEVFLGFNISGWYFKLEISATTSDDGFAIEEIGILFDVGGEVTKNS